MDNKLLETTADIAYLAGSAGYYSGDSRADIADFIWWAEEFEKIHSCTDWGEEDYMLAIEAYVEDRLAQVSEV